MVGHEAVVVELGRETGFGPGQEAEEVAERVRITEHELAVIAAGDEVVAPPIEQLAWRSGHEPLPVGDTI